LTRIFGCTAVIFDLFQTLIPLKEGVPLRTLFAQAGRLDATPDAALLRELYYSSADGRFPGVGGSMREAYAKLGVTPDEDLLREAVRHRTERHHFGFRNLDPSVIRVLESLKELEVPIALLSNSDSEIVTPYPGSPLNAIFDVAVFSHEVGLSKPDTAIFELAASRLGLPGSECLFVGDGANREFEGARNAGMTTALVMRYADASRRSEWEGFVDYVIEDIAELIPA
jgi:putative hydrolase of the HAD superfamily